LPAPELSVNVEVVMVAGFIGLLNVAVITLLGQRPVAGVVAVTVGGVSGSPGPPFLLSESLQPANAAAKKTAGIKTFVIIDALIRFS
jgi:hypothetical protein